MDDIITNMRIFLEKVHVHGIPQYIKRLQNNFSNNDVFQDLLLEGRAALMFRKAGFCVTLRESPDLALKFNNEQFYAEVKHFRLKKQDQIDDVNMTSAPDDILVPIGDSVPPAWEQVHDVAKNEKKIKQYKEHAPNILVIESSSDCIDDLNIPTAIDMINKDVRSGKCPGLAKLNGILLTSLDWYNISQRRKTFFYCTSKPAVSLSRELSDLLDDIRSG